MRPIAMTRPTLAELRDAASLQDLYPKLKHFDVGPGWNKPMPSLWKAPKKNFLPAHWNYQYCKAALEAAGRLINTELAERRNLILYNPVDGNDYATVRTLVAAYQMIMPGEWARTHRHTPNALRLILDAEPGTYTIVQGQKIAMNPGDVLLTPNWCTHGHGNDGRTPAYWIDFLDVPLVQLLEPMFFDPELDEEEGIQHEAFREPPPTLRDAQVAFPLEETLARLRATEPDPSGVFGKQVQLGNPALDTTALYMMQLQPDRPTAPLQTTANNIYAVVQGAGSSVIDGQSFAWSRGDVFAAPAWRPHFHHASEPDTLLFRVTDEPTLQRLGFLRTEAPAMSAAQVQ
jgi:gentisate 1,2-dioxygenase